MNDFEVETAASAREARSKLRASTFHMVITDMRMENESAGLEVVRAAKQASYQPAVAMLTAFPVPGSEWRDEGMDEMLVKPMNIMNLLRQIEALLVTHEDKKQKPAQKMSTPARRPPRTLGEPPHGSPPPQIRHTHSISPGSQAHWRDTATFLRLGSGAGCYCSWNRGPSLLEA